MNKMKVKVIGEWYNTKIGNVYDGEVLDIDADLARNLEARGYVRVYETKPEPVAPLVGGQVSDAGSSQAARPAPTKKVSKKREVKGG